MLVERVGFVTKTTGTSVGGASTPFLTPEDSTGIGPVMIGVTIGVSEIKDLLLGVGVVMVSRTLVVLSGITVLDVMFKLFVASYEVLDGEYLLFALLTGGGYAMSCQLHRPQHPEQQQTYLLGRLPPSWRGRSSARRRRGLGISGYLRRLRWRWWWRRRRRCMVGWI